MDDDAISRRALACCYTVHRELGPGFPVTTYRYAVTRELERSNLVFKREEPIPIIYQGEEIDRLHADFMLDTVLLQIESKTALDRQDSARMHALLKAAGLSRGLLVNFGAKELQISRVGNVPRT